MEALSKRRTPRSLRRRTRVPAVVAPGTGRESSASRRIRSRRSRLPLLLLLLGFLYLAGAFIHLQWKIYQVDKELEAYRQQKTALLEEQARLQEEIRRLNTDEYIERVAREELGLIKEGETVLLPARPGEEVPPYVPPPPGHQFRD
ncbi:MAG: Septum formation initiator [Moorella sp. 60_41]|nr:MAG: Septum formation initiator [Moorella sp. 60_41]